MKINLDDVGLGDADLEEMLRQAEQAPLEFAEAPASVQENVEQLDEIKKQRRAGNEKVAEDRDTEKYLIIVFQTPTAKKAALERLGLPVDERYVPASAVTVTAKRQLSPARSNGRSIKAADADHSGQAG